MFDTLQAAQGCAALDEGTKARRLLDDAARYSSDVGDPPGIVYWYTPSFFRLNIGLALLSLGDYADAAGHLHAGLDGLPTDQRDAEWTGEYRTALEHAKTAA
ncbi:hypothetical protein [Allosalinactinospora lopnorensis]|uniref:hypothetical protein n=1 Tax=Allosalinactinospora lopnorensis TaxID=1352348 RepID=UPI0012E11B95|nr:hypothetical protein [Allosalinactinospora lopnorensis]